MKKWAFALLILLSFGLTSCFEIVEDMTLHADGTGEVTYIINMSQSKVKLNSVLLLDSLNGHAVPSREDIKDEVTKFRRIVDGYPGVTYKSGESNTNDYIFRLTFTFESVEQLDKAMQLVGEHYNPQLKKTPVSNFEQTKNGLKRNYEYERTPAFDKLLEQEKEVLEGATFIGIYRFDQQILKFTNTKARLSKNAQSIMLRVPVADILYNRTSIANQITLKP